jgi:hypothetical protein
MIKIQSMFIASRLAALLFLGLIAITIPSQTLAAEPVDPACRNLPANNKPNFVYSGREGIAECYIERVDYTSDTDLCVRRLLGSQLPPADNNVVGTYIAKSAPKCMKFCYFNDADIKQSPPPWPVQGPNGVRPSWKAPESVICPRDDAGNWSLGTPPTNFEKRVECKQAPSTMEHGKCVTTCKLYQKYFGRILGKDYGPPPGQWVLAKTAVEKITINAQNKVESLPNPPVACVQ